MEQLKELIGYLAIFAITLPLLWTAVWGFERAIWDGESILDPLVAFGSMIMLCFATGVTGSTGGIIAIVFIGGMLTGVTSIRAHIRSKDKVGKRFDDMDLGINFPRGDFT